MDLPVEVKDTLFGKKLIKESLFLSTFETVKQEASGIRTELGKDLILQDISIGDIVGKFGVDGRIQNYIIGTVSDRSYFLVDYKLNSKIKSGLVNNTDDIKKCSVVRVSKKYTHNLIKLNINSLHDIVRYRMMEIRKLILKLNE